MEKPSSGFVRFSDRESGCDKLDIGFVFQKANLLPWRTATRNVELTLELRRGKKKMKRGDRSQLARDMLDKCGIGSDDQEKFPAWLSGGMAQRVALARALAISPDLLLLDEPFSALDKLSQESMQELLIRLWELDSTPMIVVTHDPEEAVFMADRVIILTRSPSFIQADIPIPFGRGRTAEFRKNPRYLEAVNRVRAAMRAAGYSTR